ncbi:MAG: hypothetical protein IKG70_01870 [Lachnospiraceae bacterium]|nr:hypothetical protein [Lachnospiraceae bacterium]
MGNYLYCSRPAAEMPYHIDSLQLNVYSIEELCFFIANFLPLADESVVNPSLADWLDRECRMAGTADLLRSLRGTENELQESLKVILKSGNYFLPVELTKLFAKIDEARDQDDLTRQKGRADMLLKHRKYKTAAAIYEQILETTLTSEQKEFRGRVYYNLGCANAKLFRITKARSCFERANELIGGEETAEACLAAAYMEGGEALLTAEAESIGADDLDRDRILRSVRSVEGPEIKEDPETLVREWVREYRDSTGL